MGINCKISSPVEKACKLRAGGISKVAFINFENVDRNDSDAETGKFTIGTDLTLNIGTSTGPVKFLEVSVATDSASATSTVQIGSSKDAKSLLHTVTGTIVGFGNNDVLLGEEYINYMLSNVMIAVRENSGNVFLYGYSNGLTCDNFDYSTGTAGTDLSGFTFTFSGTQVDTPIKLEPGTGETDAWTSLMNLLVTPPTPDPGD